MTGVREKTAENYVALRQLPNGLILGAHRLLFHWTMHVGVSDTGYEQRYCYATREDCVEDVMTWDGEGDPPGRWHKHPDTGRRRNPDTGEVWHESERRDDKGRPI
jgi:hypothetical protein